MATAPSNDRQADVSANTRVGSLVSDEPVLIDRFERSAHIDALADLIAAAQTPFVVAIYGAWGSGKTSFMRQLSERLEPDAGVGGTSQAIRAATVWFDPWEHSSDDNPAIGMLHAIRRDRSLESNRSVGQALTAVASASLANARLPYFGIKWSSVAKTLSEIQHVEFDRQSEQARLGTHFATVVRQALHHIPEPVPLVILVDDLDRCDPSVSVAVLESIKLFFNLDRCIFVLGVDREPLEAAIESEYGKLGIERESYLDKIVQLPFPLPALSPAVVGRAAREMLPPHLHSCAGMLAAAAADNPRRLKRAVNTLIVHDRLAQVAEPAQAINLDRQIVCALVLLQMAAPRLYAYLRAGRSYPDSQNEIAPTDLRVLLRLGYVDSIPAHVEDRLSGTDAREGLRAAMSLIESDLGANADLTTYFTFAIASEAITVEDRPVDGPRFENSVDPDEALLRRIDRAERVAAASPSSVRASLEQSRTLANAGQFDAALEAAAAAMQLAQSDGNARSAAEALGVSGEIWETVGQPVRAVEAKTESVRLLAALVKGDDAQLGVSLASLSQSLLKADRTVEALETGKRAISVLEGAPDAEGSQLATALSSHSDVLMAMDAVEEAEQTMRRAILIFESELGSDHRLVAQALTNLSVIQARNGRADDAQGSQDRALEILNRRLGQKHPDTLVARQNLAVLASAAGQTGKARRILNELLIDAHEVLGASHPSVLEIRHQIALAERDSGEIDRAEQLLSELLSDLRRELGPDHSTTRAVVRELSEIQQTSPDAPRPSNFEQPRVQSQLPRSKPRLNVGTIGHVDHGKTTLTAAISSVLAEGGLAEVVTFAELDDAPDEQLRGLSVSKSELEYETTQRHYTHIDLPGHRDFVKNMIAGANLMDAAILVVAATDGPTPQTREHVLLSRMAGVGQILVALTKVDMVDDEELLELVEFEIRELLNEYEYPGDDVPITRVSGLRALEGDGAARNQVRQLLAECDSYFRDSVRQVDRPFLMPIEDVFTITERGVVVTGLIEQGVVRTGDELEIVGLRDTQETVCTGIEMFRKLLDEGQAGDNVGVLLRGIRKEDVEPGQVLCVPGEFVALSKFTAQVYVLDAEEGGDNRPFLDGFRPEFFVRTGSVHGTVTIPPSMQMVMPGDNVELQVDLDRPIALADGLRFSIRHEGRMIGVGRVVQIRG